MILWFLKWFIFSFVLIIIFHYLYNFYIDILTIPKNKDYIYNQQERYNKINNLDNNLDNQVNNNDELKQKLTDDIRNEFKLKLIEKIKAKQNSK
jgi:hypothetical protein